jgi:NAD(P)-dependent dehydrogenase (short-subunit alcohol dehydrogenase family)
VAQEDDLDGLVAFTLKKHAKIDILVNNAGVICAEGLFDTTIEMWERTMAINLTGPFMLSQKVARSMAARKTGRIINVSSIFGVLGYVTSTAYIASKGGLIALTKQMACELGKFQITVNAILPSTVRTGFFKEPRLEDPDSTISPEGLFDEQRLTKLRARAPLGEIIDPEDIAHTALFLASDEARRLTGACVPVDGGVMAGRMD